MQLNFWVSDLFIQYRPIMQSGNCTQRIIFIVTRLVRFGDAGTAAQQGARAIARDLLGKMVAPLDHNLRCLPMTRGFKRSRFAYFSLSSIRCAFLCL
jgi:hypothetical protein